jgi:membrane fusion protein (multidrug efflux system)
MNSSIQTQSPDHSPAAQVRPKSAQRKRLLRITAIGVVAIGLLVGAWRFFFAGRSETTENAYTAVEVAQITPQIAGVVREVRVSDTESVRADDVLVVLDDTDAKLAVAQAEAELARAKRQVQQLLANDFNLASQLNLRAAEIQSAHSDLIKATATLEKATIDEKRRRNLAEGGAVSQEEVTDAATQLREAQAEVDQAQARVLVAEAARDAAGGARQANAALTVDSTVETNPVVLIAVAHLDQARVMLERTVLRAPLDGVIAQRAVDVGQQVTAGARLMSVVPIGRMHVDANFKEGQLRKVVPGQSVRLTSDLYGDAVVYTGSVEGFAGGSGSAFSAIPAQNATGNWIKVVQRLPVRIRLDPEQLAIHPLRVGLSMEATVDVADRARSGTTYNGKAP